MTIMQQTPESDILEFTLIKESDAEQLFPLALDPEVTQYLTWDATTKEEMAKFYVLEADKARKGITYSFCLFVADTNTPIGSGGLIGISSIHKSACLGFWIGKPFWLKGYGTELVNSLLQFAFTELDLHRVYCSVRTDNIASISLLEKTGFRKEGHTIKSFWRQGHFNDLYQYAVLEEEFAKR